MPAYLQYLLGDRAELELHPIGLVGLLVFSTAFLTARLNRWVGLRRLLLFSAGGLGLVRLGMQVWAGDPLGDMALAMLGTIFFLQFLPAWLTLARQPADFGDPPDRAAGHRFALSILLGLAFDTALHGLFLTYDFIWQAGFSAPGPDAGTGPRPVGGAAKFIGPYPRPAVPGKATFFRHAAVVGCRPFFFLQMLVFQNQARLAALTGWSLPAVLWLGVDRPFAGSPFCRPAAVEQNRGRHCGDSFGDGPVPFGAAGPIGHAPAFLLGQVSAAVLLALWCAVSGRRLPGCPSTRLPRGLNRLANITVVHGISMVLLSR